MGRAIAPLEEETAAGATFLVGHRSTLGGMRRDALEHYLDDDSRRDEASEGSFSGAAGGAACGDLCRVSLCLCDGRVERASFDAEGCGTMLAAGAAVAELAEGSSVLDVASIGSPEIDAALGGLSPAKLHAAQLASDALHRALAAAAASDATLAPPRGARVLVAMSGGVDSTVAALLERERGADVVGVTLKLWADPKTDGTKACCSPEAVLGARRLAHSLGIPHLTLDLEEEFRRRVVGRFLSGHAGGETPNPCVLCNGEVRLAAMIDLADRLGAIDLVTGHYARVVEDADGPLLAAAADPGKDQSYMLASLPPEHLARMRFPLAEMTKPEVRAVAERHGLDVHRKPDSQDLCFLAGTGKREFLQRHAGLGDREGDLVDRRGRRLGRHRGHQHFTVGQRKGIGVAGTQPLYVLGTDASTNAVTVGAREDLEVSSVAIRDAVLHRDGARVDGVRLRYHANVVPAAVSSAATGRHGSLTVDLHEPFAGAAPGQAAVLLSGDRIVGHGTIARA